MIYGIIVFDLRKGSEIHRKGFRMFLEMFGYENTLFGTKGKAHEAFEKCKRKFVCGYQMLFGDPDEIMDMTRNSGMVRR